jgi:DNA-binding NarL/FixJ family response regulator
MAQGVRGSSQNHPSACVKIAIKQSPDSFICLFVLNRYAPDLGDVMTRILIADDRQSMRIALKTLFVLRPSWEICGEAEDGREAISMASDLRPDLIVLDFKMPLTDGLQAAQEIGRNLPTTPIVMYTFYKDEQLESVARSAGVRRVVAKENGVHELIGAIEAEVRDLET